MFRQFVIDYRWFFLDYLLFFIDYLFFIDNLLSLIIIFCSLLITVYIGNRGVEVEARITIPQILSSIPPYARFLIFSQGKISGKFRKCLPTSRHVKYQHRKGTPLTEDHVNIWKIPDFGKMLENFATWARKFPDHIKQSFSPPLTVWSWPLAPHYAVDPPLPSREWGNRERGCGRKG